MSIAEGFRLLLEEIFGTPVTIKYHEKGDKYMLGINEQYLIKLKRYAFHSNCTRGILTIDGIELQTLEPPRQKKKPRCIPSGLYKIVLEYSDRFKRVLPELKDVPGFTEIKLHAGNYPSDTKGCIIPGMKGREDMVERSREAMELIFKALIEAHKQGKILWIEIID